MKEIASSLLIMGIFLIGSYFIHYYLKTIKSVFWLTAVILTYFVSIYLFFELINKIHQLLRDREIYIEFGHASILLIELFIICIIIGIINIIWAINKRSKFLKKII
jgi:hypothetical protein